MPPTTDTRTASASFAADRREQDYRDSAAHIEAEQERATIKTAKEINDLKRAWRLDPCWDIYETVGYEAHRSELMAYQTEAETRWDKTEMERVNEKAKKLGCTVALVQYIEVLERRIITNDRTLIP